MAFIILQSVFWLLIAFLIVFAFSRFLNKKSRTDNKNYKLEQNTPTDPSYISTAAKLAKKIPQKHTSTPFDIALTAEINRVKNLKSSQASSPSYLKKIINRQYAAIAITISLSAFILVSLMSYLKSNQLEDIITIKSPEHLLPQQSNKQLSRNQKEQEITYNQQDNDYPIAILQPVSDQEKTESYLSNTISFAEPETFETKKNRNRLIQEKQEQTQIQEKLELALAQAQEKLQAETLRKLEQEQFLEKQKLIQTQEKRELAQEQERLKQTKALEKIKQEQLLEKQELAQIQKKQEKAQTQLEQTKKQTIIQKLIIVSTDFAHQNLRLNKKEIEINAMDELFAATKSHHYKNQKKLLVSRRTQLNKEMQALSQQYLQQLQYLCDFPQPHALTLPDPISPIERIASQHLKQQLTTCLHYKTMSTKQIRKILHNNYKILASTN